MNAKGSCRESNVEKYSLEELWKRITNKIFHPFGEYPKKLQ